METEDSGRSAEGHGRIDFGSSKGVAAIDIQQAWRERGRVGWGKHGHKRIGERRGALVYWDGDR